MHNDVELFFQEAKKTDFKDIQNSYYKTGDGDHGRIEERHHWVVSDTGWLNGKSQWKGLSSIGMVERERDIDGKISFETSYYILSPKCNAKVFADSTRKHWEIENKLHWGLDVSFREDECRKRTGNSAENFAIIRHVALNLLKQENSMRKSIKTKRLQAVSHESTWSQYILNAFALLSTRDSGNQKSQR